MRNELARWEVRAIRRVVRHFTFCNVHLHLLHFLLSSEILDECGVVNRTLRFKYKSNQIVYMQIISFSYCNIFLEVRGSLLFYMQKKYHFTEQFMEERQGQQIQESSCHHQRVQDSKDLDLSSMHDFHGTIRRSSSQQTIECRHQ